MEEPKQAYLVYVTEGDYEHPALVRAASPEEAQSAPSTAGPRKGRACDIPSLPTNFPPKLWRTPYSGWPT